MKSTGRTKALYYVTHKGSYTNLSLKKKWFTVSSYAEVSEWDTSIINLRKQILEKSGMHLQRNHSVSFHFENKCFFILLWKKKKKISPYCFGHFHFLQGLVLLKAVIKRTSSPKVIWKCIKLSSSSTVWN